MCICGSKVCFPPLSTRHNSCLQIGAIIATLIAAPVHMLHLLSRGYSVLAGQCRAAHMQHMACSLASCVEELSPATACSHTANLNICTPASAHRASACKHRSNSFASVCRAHKKRVAITGHPRILIPKERRPRVMRHRGRGDKCRRKGGGTGASENSQCLIWTP